MFLYRPFTRMVLRCMRPRSTATFIISALFCTLVLFAIVQNQYQIKNVFSYTTRPLWDKEAGPNDVIPHYYGEGLKMDANTCQLHGWTERQEKEDLKVLDAVLMSSELDLLEIRMNELDSVVDYFLIVESNTTFTGLSKETYFASNSNRFSKFHHKIVYHFLPGFPLLSGQSPWDIEAHTRDTMTMLIRNHITRFPSNTKTMVVMTDLDEIPAGHSVDLLKNCDFGSSIHLQLRDYIYSFEWYLGLTSWRASAVIWNQNSYYRHSQSGERILADAGWHCSYCFRTLSEYIVKMKGFSHADRIAGRLNLLEPKRIQDTICKGKDIFGMFPEAYSYIDFFSKMYLQPLKTAVGLPRYLFENASKFRFLLPGGCVRES